MTLQEQLKELDAKATQGEWRITQAETHGKPYGQPFIMAYDEHGEILDRQMSGSGGARSWSSYVIENRFCADDEENNLLFIAALVNAYRSGQLVPLPEVEEQIAAARQAALEAAAKVAQAKGPTHAYIAQAIRNLAKGKE